MILLLAVSLDTGQWIKNLGGGARNSMERPDVLVSLIHVSVRVCFHWPAKRPSQPAMGAMSLKSVVAAKGAIAPPVKWPLVLEAWSGSVC